MGRGGPGEVALVLTAVGASQPAFADRRVVPLLLPSAGSRAATLGCERICFFVLNSG